MTTAGTTRRASIKQHVREALCAPLLGRYGVVGAIYLDTTTPPHEVVITDGACRFDDEHLKLLVSVAHQAALAIEDTNYYQAMVASERLAAVGQTIAILSHDVKNILQGVRGASYLIEQGLNNGDDEVVRRGWRMVERNQERIYHLVMDMLSYGKDREPCLDEANVNDLVSEVVELMRQKAEDAGVTLTFSDEHRLPPAWFDAEMLHRAVLNIVGNAVDACRDNGDSVRISTEYLDDRPGNPHPRRGRWLGRRRGRSRKNLHRLLFPQGRRRIGAGAGRQSQGYARTWRRRGRRQYAWAGQPLYAPPPTRRSLGNDGTAARRRRSGSRIKTRSAAQTYTSQVKVRCISGRPYSAPPVSTSKFLRRRGLAGSVSVAAENR